MAVVELNYTDQVKKETALKLGISEAQLERIYKLIKEIKPLYHYGYDYDRILAYINKNAGRITI